MTQLERERNPTLPKKWHILVSNKEGERCTSKLQNKELVWQRLVPIMRNIPNVDEWHVLQPLTSSTDHRESCTLLKENDYKSLELHQYCMIEKEKEETKLEQKQKLSRLRLQLKRLHYENEHLENENERLLDEKRLLIEIKCLYKEFLLPEDSDYSLRDTTLTKEFSDEDELGSLGSNDRENTDIEQQEIAKSVLQRYNSILSDDTSNSHLRSHVDASLSSTQTSELHVIRNEKNKRDEEEIFHLKKEIVFLLMRNEKLMKENEGLRGDRDHLIHKKSYYKKLLET